MNQTWQFTVGSVMLMLPVFVGIYFLSFCRQFWHVALAALVAEFVSQLLSPLITMLFQARFYLMFIYPMFWVLTSWAGMNLFLVPLFAHFLLLAFCFWLLIYRRRVVA